MVWAPREAAPLRVVSPGRAGSSMVGRAVEMARLRRALAASRVRGTAAVILGEAGIGKSRLLAELRADADDAFLIGSCPSLPALATPYAPFTASFRALLRQRGRRWFERVLGPGTAELGAILPALGHLPSAGLSSERRPRLFDAVHGVLVAAAAEGPLVLAVEDVHWANDSTLALLSSLVTDPPDGVLVVATAREEALGTIAAGLVAEAARGADRAIVRLAPFGVDEVAALIARITGAPVSAEEARSVHRRTGGNPFLVEELLASPDAGADLGANLALRLASLGTDARTVAWLVAVDPEPMEAPLLEAAAALPRSRLREAVAACSAAGLLVVDGRTRSYRYRHALLQDAIESGIPPLERAGLHAAIATAMERVAVAVAAGPGRAARHWLAAGRPKRALPQLDAAARQATRAGAFSEALTIRETLLRAWRSVPGGASKAHSEARLLGDVAMAHGDLGDAATADATYATALAASADDEERLLLHAERVQWLWNSGREREARPMRQELADLGARTGPEIRSPDLLAAVVRAMVGESRFAEAEPLARLVAARARDAQRSDLECGGHAALGLALGLTDRPDEGARHLQLAAELALAGGHHGALLYVIRNLAALLGDHERREQLRGLIEHWSAYAERTRAATFRNEMDVLRIEDLTFSGRWPEAQRLIDQLQAQRNARPGSLDEALLCRLGIEARQGRTAAAEILVDELRRSSRQQAHFSGPFAFWRARLAIAAGKLDLAGKLLHEHLETAVRSVEAGDWYRAAALGLETERLRLQAGRADARTGAARIRVLEHRRRAWAPPALNATAVRACRFDMRAELAEMRGRRAAPIRVLAAETWEALQSPADSAEAWLRAARSLVAEGNVRQARPALDRAGELAAALAMRPLLADVSRLRLEADGRRRQAVVLGDGRTLTRRELEVLRRIVAGRTNREIAAELVIGEKTAATHVSNLLGKLGAGSRTEAAVAALRLGVELQ